MDGLRKAMNVKDEDTEELQNLYYSNLGPLAQADWQRYTNTRFAPESLATIELEPSKQERGSSDDSSDGGDEETPTELDDTTVEGKIPRKTKKQVADPKVAVKERRRRPWTL